MKVVIFGAGPFASRGWHALTHDSDHDVAGFCVDAAYVGAGQLHDLPVVDFAHVEAAFPPASHDMLVHLGPLQVNTLRASRCAAARKKGYRLISHVSSRAVTWPGLQMGDNCVVYEGATVNPFVTLGDNVMIGSGAHIAHHVSLGDDCFIAAGAVIGGGSVIGRRCFIGLNATVLEGVNVADGCIIGAGAVLTKDTQPDGLYVGVPARRSPKSPASVDDD